MLAFGTSLFYFTDDFNKETIPTANKAQKKKKPKNFKMMLLV